MAANKLEFELGDFNLIFPFFLLIDEQLMIVEQGNSYAKINIECRKQKLTDLFFFERPTIDKLDFQSMLQICDQLTLFRYSAHHTLAFRGQFHLLPDKKQLIFLGAPWFDSSVQFSESGLKFNDFAPHNQMLDLLHLVHTQEIANEELKTVLHSLKIQKAELERTQKSLREIQSTLEESNRRYEYVNQATTEAIWDWNILTGEVYYGAAFEKIFGYKIKEQTYNFNIWEKRIHPDDVERITNQINAYILSDIVKWKEEYRYLKADGKYAHVYDKGFIVRNEKGQAVRMIGAMSDISEKKAEEQQLKLLESVITHTNDAVLITDASECNNIIYVNEAFTKTTGYRLEEIKGKNPKFLQGPDSSREHLIALKEAIKNFTAYEITTINYKKNRMPYWVHFSVRPVADDKGTYTHWISIQRDVTDIVTANAELENQKKFTEDILKNIPTDIAVFDKNHNYLYINPNAIKNEEMRKWMIGKNDFDYIKLKNLDDFIAKRRWSLFEQAVQNRSAVEWIDEHKNTDGSPTFFLRHFYPYFENDDLKFVIGYGIDISERKQVEIKLKEALIKLRVSNKELEQFAYIASHDLQEPLRMVSSFLSQIEKKYGAIIDDKGKEYIHYAVDGAKRMRQIILDLLEYSRAGKSDDPFVEVDTQELVEEILSLLKTRIEELQANVVFSNLPLVFGHKTPLRQVFQNLISNSLKYHREGVAPNINIEAITQSDYWEFVVTDNGIGIDPEYFDRIFIIFQRLHNKDEYTGTGIGLAITKKIIDRLGGKIWVASKEGEGSSFHFTIPFGKNTLIS
jgi:PAS domain S-box-containing protein